MDRTVRLLLAALAVAATMALAGCGGSGVATRTARVGGSLTLTGQADAHVQVTVRSVSDPVDPGRELVNHTGDRFVGVRVTLRNVGGGVYSDAAVNGAQLLTAATATPILAKELDGPCAGFPVPLRLGPGASARGCFGFELPAGARPGSFRYSLSSGSTPDIGQWDVRLPARGAAARLARRAPFHLRDLRAGQVICRDQVIALSDTSCGLAEALRTSVLEFNRAHRALPAATTAVDPANGAVKRFNCSASPSPQFPLARSTLSCSSTLQIPERVFIVIDHPVQP